MSVAIQGLIFGWKKNLDYGIRLISDLSESQMIAQPKTPEGVVVNHPAWVFSHLNLYHPIISALIEGHEFDDPKGHNFGMQSKPELDAKIYPGKSELTAAYISGHEKVLKQLEVATDAMLSNPVKLARWRDIMPQAGIALPYLMLVHENQHLGQISAWRRTMGLPSA